MTFVELRQTHKTYRQRGQDVFAVRGVDLRIARGQTLALVGESGCGKSTLGRLMAGVSRQTTGHVLLDGRDLYSQCESDPMARRRVQMVFQHPFQSLNPRFTIEQTLEEPLRLTSQSQRSERAERIRSIMKVVGLEESHLRRRPAELSGGQQQRVALARALMSQPDLIVLDEPTASLDQSVRRRIIALLKQVQEATGVSYLFITHDLGVVPLIAHSVAVMYLGKVVEQASPSELMTDPAHPYTMALLAAAPRLVVGRRAWTVITGETPNSTELPVGCAFRDRCPIAIPRCASEIPQLLTERPGHDVACFRPWTQATPVTPEDPS